MEQSADRALRKSAFENFYSAFGQFRNTFAAAWRAR